MRETAAVSARLLAVKALVAGDAEAATALCAALREQGVDAEAYATQPTAEERSVGSLAGALVELEERLGAGYDVAVVAGPGDAAMALAIVAAKLGLPLAASLEAGQPSSGELDAAERRILTELADVVARADTGPNPALAAAQRIASWGREGSASGDAIGAAEA